MEVLATLIATLATCTITVLAALAYWRDRGFPMLEAIRLARETRTWMQATEVVHRGETSKVWTIFPFKRDLNALGERKLRGYSLRRRDR